MQPGSAGLPHLPKGDRLLESHARNSAKSHSQSEYDIRHRLTEWHGPAGLIRKVARAAYQRTKPRPRSSPTAPWLPPASAEVAAAFTFEHPDVFSGAETWKQGRGPVGGSERTQRILPPPRLDLGRVRPLRSPGTTIRPRQSIIASAAGTHLPASLMTDGSSRQAHPRTHALELATSERRSRRKSAVSHPLKMT